MPFYPGMWGSSTCNVETLSRELTDVSGSEWFNLGIQLGVKDATLRDIEANHKGDVQRCKTEMLSVWLQSGPTNPRKKLAATLENMGKKMLAQRILQLGKCNTILPQKVKGTVCCVWSCFEEPFLGVYVWATASTLLVSTHFHIETKGDRFVFL